MPATTQLHERYEAVELLGTNDYSTVYRGCDHQLDRPIVVMALPERLLHDHRRIGSIWEQIERLTRCAHPHLVEHHDLVRELGWIIAEWVPSSVAAEMSHGAFEPERVARMLRQSLGALDALHRQEFLHGDIRPKNLLTDGNDLKLSRPFGLAVAGEIPRRRLNHKYMAPELLHGSLGAPGEWTDLYCLGFAMYELSVGSRFDELLLGESATVRDDPKSLALVWERWHANSQNGLPPLVEANPAVPLELAECIDRLTRKIPAERFQSAKEALRSMPSNDKSDRNRPAAAGTPYAADRLQVPLVIRDTTSGYNNRPAGPKLPVKKPVNSGSFSDRLNQKLKNPFVMAMVILGFCSLPVLAILVNMWSDKSALVADVAPTESKHSGNDPIEDASDRPDRPIYETSAKVAVDYEARGAVKLRDGLFDEAIVDFSRALELDDQAWFAYFGRGRAHVGHRDFDRAIGDLQIAKKLNAPAAAVVDRELALAFVQRARQAIDRGRLEVALADLTRAIELDATRAEAYALRADVLLQQAKIAEALADLAIARKLEPKNPLHVERAIAAHLRFCDMLFERDESDSAIAQLDRALELDSQCVAAYLKKAQVQLASDRFSEALKSYDQVLELTTTHAPALWGRSQCHLKLGELEKGLADYYSARKQGYEPDELLVGQLASAFATRGKRHLTLREYEGAIGDLELACHLAPQQTALWRDLTAEAYYRGGSVLAKQNHMAEAIGYFGKAVRLQSRWQYDALTNRGYSFIKLNRFQEAIDDLTSAIALDNHRSIAFQNRHYAYKQVGDAERAAADLATAKSLLASDQ